MELMTLVIQQNILDREPGAAQMIREAKDLGLQVYVQGKEEFARMVLACEIEIENCLYLVAEVSQWKQALDLGCATLPCRYDGKGEYSGAWMVAEGLEEIDIDFLDKVFRRCHGLPWKILTTQRCYLREITMEDMDDLFRLYEGEDITKYMEPLYERSKEEEYQRAYIANMYRYYGYGMWMVCRKDDGRIIGRAGLEHREVGDENWIEMGYMIDAKEQRKGYATEVCRGIIEYAKEILPGERLNCFIEEGNSVSMRMMERLGFSCKGKLAIDGRNMYRYTKD